MGRDNDEQVFNSYNIAGTYICCSMRGAGINTVWLCNSNVWMLQSSFDMYNIL